MVGVEALVMLLAPVIFPPIVALVIFVPAVMFVSGVLIFCAATKFTARTESTAITGRITASSFLIIHPQKIISNKFLVTQFHNNTMKFCDRI
jgi:hypothetical protein